MSEEESQVEDQSIIEVTDIGINTDELSPEELQKLVDNNKELHENEVINISHELKDRRLNGSEEENKEDLINDLIKKEKYFEMLSSYNIELKNKIEISNQRYKDVLEKIEEKKNEDTEGKLTNQIKEMEKEINANNTETERYKRMIDKLKNKIEFKTNLERAFNLQHLLKNETNKNNDLKKQYNDLLKLNESQLKFIEEYDKENEITEKIDILKKEIKVSKENIKDYQDKIIRQDRFIRLIHEKILTLEIMLKKIKDTKIRIKDIHKSFTKEEFKDTILLIITLKEQIKDCRNQLDSINKANDEKMHQLLYQNRQIEIDYKQAEKDNKNLQIKKNELKRKIKNLNMLSKKKKLFLKESINNYNINNENIKENENIKNNEKLENNEKKNLEKYNYDKKNTIKKKENEILQKENKKIIENTNEEYITNENDNNSNNE